jgi:hypothetical protein
MSLFSSKERKVSGSGMQASKVSPKRTVALWDRLAVLFVVLALLIAGYAIFGFVSAPQSTPPEVADDSRADSNIIPAPQDPVSFDVYAPVFSGRDIFKTDEEKIIEETANPQPQIDTTSLVSWGANYQLAGVIVDGDPRAVIRVLNPPGMEFLTVGDHLGEAVLTKVEENRVWFSYQNQQVELKFETEKKLEMQK